MPLPLEQAWWNSLVLFVSHLVDQSSSLREMSAVAWCQDRVATPTRHPVIKSVIVIDEIYLALGVTCATPFNHPLQ